MTDFLVVEDDGLLRETLIDELADNFPGTKIVGAASSGEALRIIENEPPKLIVSDWRLGNRDDASVILRHLAETHTAIPVIIYTGTKTDSIVTCMKQCGLEPNILSKPARPGVIAAMIGKLLPSRPERPPSAGFRNDPNP